MKIRAYPLTRRTVIEPLRQFAMYHPGQKSTTIAPGLSEQVRDAISTPASAVSACSEAVRDAILVEVIHAIWLPY